MSQTTANTAFELNLVESNTFVKTVKFKVPGKAADSWRQGEFKATFKVLSETEQEDLPGDITVREYLRLVLLEVDGIPAAKAPDGADLSPVEVVIYNQFTMDAAHATYQMYMKENGFDIAHTAADRKNSKRSRGR